MPNKEKSVRTVQQSNDNDAIRTESMTTDVITTDVKKGANNKKREKHKNKEAIKTTNNVNTVNENGLNATPVNEHDDPEIRAVGEELLRRLQCNGTSISVRRPNDSDHNSAQQFSSKPGDNGLTTVQSQQKSNQSNSNNNNSKAHIKNCQNQNKSAKTVNNSSNNVASDGTSAIVQCNGTHSTTMAQSAEHHVNQATGTNTHLPGSSTEDGTKPKVATAKQIEAAVTSKDSVHAMASCSSQHHPSTSTSIPTECPQLSLPRSALSVKSIKTSTVEVTFKEYENELQMPDIMRVIQRELSEPYSIYTYRYFIHNWPKLCFLAMDGDNCIGAIVCKLDVHRQVTKRGYIAMLAVDAAYRKLKVGTTLVQKAIEVIFFFIEIQIRMLSIK